MAEISMAGASALLMLRALALWNRRIEVVVPVMLLHLGQWALVIHSSVVLKEEWGPLGNGEQGCKPVVVPWRWFKIQFIYSERLAPCYARLLLITKYCPSDVLRLHRPRAGVIFPSANARPLFVALELALHRRTRLLRRRVRFVFGLHHYGVYLDQPVATLRVLGRRHCHVSNKALHVVFSLLTRLFRATIVACRSFIRLFVEAELSYASNSEPLYL